MTENEGKLCFCVLAFRNTLILSVISRQLQVLEIFLLRKYKGLRYGTCDL